MYESTFKTYKPGPPALYFCFAGYWTFHTFSPLALTDDLDGWWSSSNSCQPPGNTITNVAAQKMHRCQLPPTMTHNMLLSLVTHRDAQHASIATQQDAQLASARCHAL
eukprot:scaffold14083_cov21-Tisochrysis_lutea.AAC.3